MNIIDQAPKLAINNRKEVMASLMASCYFCCKIINTSEIKSFTDKGNTILCPFCNCDTVIAGEVPERDLRQIKDYWI